MRCRARKAYRSQVHTHTRVRTHTNKHTHTYHAYMLFKKCMKNTFALTIVYAIYQTKISARQGYSLALEVVFYQRGLSEAQNGYGFGMIPGHGRPDVNLSSLVLDGSPA